MLMYFGDFFLLFWMVLLIGFKVKRPFLLLLLLNLEGFFFVYFWLALFLSSMGIFFFTMISLLTIAVLEAALGLTILVLLMRYFRSSNVTLLNHLKS